MTLSEFSNQFDVLFNNISSNGAPGLNEYEKSVFLTMAQDIIVRSYFNPKSDPRQEGIDGSVERQADYSMLIKTGIAEDVDNDTSAPYDPRSLMFRMPDDVFLIINEQMQLSGTDLPTAVRQVVPITFTEYFRQMSKPFKEPLKWQAWRLITDNTSVNENNQTSLTTDAANKIHPLAEIIMTSSDKAKYAEGTFAYKIRYVRRPKPIILVNLTGTLEGLSINDEERATDCELDPIVHSDILETAVKLAYQAWVGAATTSSSKSKKSDDE